MGAKWIYDVSLEKTLPATAEREVLRRLEAHTGRRVGTWEVNCAVFGTSDKKRPTIEVVSFSDVEAHLFVVVNNGATLVETDRAMPAMIKRISPYGPRHTRAIRGTEYDFLDFCVRVGVMFDRNNSAYGVVVEIEYRPCPVAADCEELIGDLMEKIAAPLVPPPNGNSDRAVNDAAWGGYDCKKIEPDLKTFNPKDLNPFSHRTAALLYAKLLRK